MKKLLLFALLPLLFNSCAEEFTANTDNPLMVGSWAITEVDDAEALASGQTLTLSILEDNYVEGNVFTFEEGANFELKSTDGKSLIKGEYGIGEGDASLQLKDAEGNVISYDLEKKGESFKMNVTTTGELINLTITKV